MRVQNLYNGFKSHSDRFRRTIRDPIKALLKLNYETMLFIEAGEKNVRLQSPSFGNLVVAR